MKFIKFEKDGCMPCRKMDAILTKLGLEYEKVDVEDEASAELLTTYSIFSTPTLVKVLPNGFEKLIGVQHTSDEFQDFCGLSTSEDVAEESDMEEGSCCKDGVCSF